MLPGDSFAVGARSGWWSMANTPLMPRDYYQCPVCQHRFRSVVGWPGGRRIQRRCTKCGEQVPELFRAHKMKAGRKPKSLAADEPNIREQLAEALYVLEVIARRYKYALDEETHDHIQRQLNAEPTKEKAHPESWRPM